MGTFKLFHIDWTRLLLRARHDYFLSRSLTVDQTTDIVLYSADKYTKAVYTQEFGYVERSRPDPPRAHAHAAWLCSRMCLSVLDLERRWSPAAPTRTLCPSRLCWPTTRRSEGWRWTGGWRTRTLTWPPPLCEFKVKLVSGVWFVPHGRFTSTGASPQINLLIKSSTSCHSSFSTGCGRD